MKCACLHFKFLLNVLYATPLENTHMLHQFEILDFQKKITPSKQTRDLNPALNADYTNGKPDKMNLKLKFIQSFIWSRSLDSFKKMEKKYGAKCGAGEHKGKFEGKRSLRLRQRHKIDIILALKERTGDVWLREKFGEINRNRRGCARRSTETETPDDDEHTP
uniref:Uncharacterized protein n=1 Tax=Timema cristinae TaxID=61476 RepID=A0A7R9CBB5_TIMCR|nr:unnamed protein product [Timema cristinae]